MNIFDIFSMLRGKRLKNFLRIYKRIFSLALPEMPKLIPAFILLLFGVGVMLTMPRVMGIALNKIIEGDFASLDRIGVILAGIIIFEGVAQVVRAYLFILAGLKVVTDLSKTTYRRIMHQEVGFFDLRKTGELLSRLSSDTAALQNAVSTNLGMFLRALVLFIGAVGLMIYTSPRLSLYAAAIVPVVSFLSVWFGRRIRNLSTIVQDKLADASEVAEETISGARTVRSFAREDREIGRYAGRINIAYGAMKTRAVYISFFRSLVMFSSFAAIGAIFWFGAKQVEGGGLSPGELMTFLIYAMMVSGQLSTISNLFTDFMRAAGSAKRLFEILDRQPAMALRGGEAPGQVEGRIEFREVSFAYPMRPDVLALDSVDLRLDPGEIVALVGPSGGGKSTIANIITRFYDPSSGQVLLDGRPLDTLDPSWLRQQIGVVAQEPHLFSCSIAENIGYGRVHYDQDQVVEAAKLANAHDFIELFPQGYETEVGERGARLSGGQKQRIAIARAILKNPKVLILDEATSALDAESEFLVKQALDRLMKGRTTLVIAHRLSTVKDAHRVAVVEAGRIVESGTHDELMAREESLYRKLVERQHFLVDGAETAA